MLAARALFLSCCQCVRATGLVWPHEAFPSGSIHGESTVYQLKNFTQMGVFNNTGRRIFISRSGRPAAAPASILCDFGRVGSVFGACYQYDSVSFGFRVAGGVRVYVRDHFAHTVQTDDLIRLARRAAHQPTVSL